MATRQVPLLGPTARPDNSGDVFFEPYSEKATNDVWDHLVTVFNSTSARVELYGTAEIPQDYQNTAQLIVVWTSATTSGDVVWDFDYRAVGGDDVESLDQTGTQETVSVTDTAPSAAQERMEVSVALTDGNFFAGDTVEFLLARDGADASDTLSDAVLVFGAFFRYSDTA